MGAHGMRCHWHGPTVPSRESDQRSSRELSSAWLADNVYCTFLLQWSQYWLAKMRLSVGSISQDVLLKLADFNVPISEMRQEIVF